MVPAEKMSGWKFLCLGFGFVGGSLALVIGLALLATPQEARAAAEELCRVDPSLRDLELLCAAGRLPRDECVLLDSAQHLAGRDREGSTKVLREGLDLPADTLNGLIPTIQMLSLSLLEVDTEAPCGQNHVLQLLGFLADGLWDSWGTPAVALFVGPLLYQLDADKVQVLEDKTGPELAAEVIEVRQRFERLMGRTPIGAKILEGASLAFAATLMSGSKLPGASVQNHAARVALELAEEGEFERARHVMRDSAATLSAEELGTSYFIFGVGLHSLGAIEDAALAIRESEEILVDVDSEKSKLLRTMAPALRAMIWSDIELTPPGSATRTRESDLTPSTIEQLMALSNSGYVSGESGGIADVASLLVALASRLSWEDGQVQAMVALIDELPGLEQLREIETNPRLWQEGQDFWAAYFDFQVGIRDPRELEDVEMAIATLRPYYSGLRSRALDLGAVILQRRRGMLTDEDAARQTREIVDAFEADIEAKYRLDRSMLNFIGINVDAFFHLAIDFSNAMGRDADAFSYVERNRSWTFRRRFGGRRDPADPRYEAQIRKATEKVAQLESKLAKGEAEEHEVASARQDLEQVPFRTRLDQPERYALGSVEPVGLEELQRRLTPQQTVLMYFFRDEKALYSWQVGKDRFEAARVVAGTELERLACLTRDLQSEGRSDVRSAERLGPYDCQDSQEEPSKALYELLIEPLGTPATEELIIIPHGPLHRVPFAALKSPRSHRYLVEDHQITLVPSASVLAMLVDAEERHATKGGSPTPRPSKGNVLVLGAPSLDGSLPALAGARFEAERVSELFGVVPHLESSATESLLRIEGPKSGLIHIAAHALYDVDRARQSRLLLAGDEIHDGRMTVLEVEELLDLSQTRLVTLSACETGIGELTGGDEILSLTRAFLVAGSQAVVSTLWRVDDTASAHLMVDFYRNVRAGIPVSEALQRAQREQLENPETASPYFWAGYTVTGSPNVRWSAPLKELSK